MTLKKIIFYRDYKKFQGGHLKVWNYFNYCQHHPNYNADISFSAGSDLLNNNPWLLSKKKHNDSLLNLDKYDVFFIAGKDWSFFLNHSPSPKQIIINLIQGFSHVQPTDDKFQYLAYKAIRICVSEELKSELLRTKKVNGPLFTIPNGVNDANVSVRKGYSDYQKIIIIGYKQKELACSIYEKLTDLGLYEVELLLEDDLPRKNFLEKVNNSTIALFLPFFTEGFFLPAMEAMLFNTVVICPDCVGNRGFCLDGYNCYSPSYSIEAIIESVKKAYSLSPEQRSKLVENANRMSQSSSMKERELFSDILNNLECIWDGA